MSSTEFDRHVAEQPDVVEELLAHTEVPRLDPARPLVLTGIGTSLHACRIAATWVRRLSGGRIRPVAIDAHDLALTESLTAADQVVVVSHRGTKRYPNEVLSAARSVGAATVCVTGQGAVLPDADVVLRASRQERASTHSVSYTSALTVLGRLVCELLPDASKELADALAAAPDAMRRTLGLELSRRATDTLVNGAPHPFLITGTGLDAVTAAEAALKIKEGTYRWSEALHTEFALHGTPAVFAATTAACLIRPGLPDGGRTDDLAGYLTALGAPVLISDSRPGADLPFADVPELARPLVTLLPFHRLVSAAAARLGASPDLTHLESEPWTSAAGAVSL
ncbi:SIS domain-containing protein [Streptomyces sp. NPDC047046]|uniref:SIS domain-containing protein n=1 Tax=Streptomyces sp. NPDC047046 TaxID=3155378 RepID=UPI0033DBFDA5